ncbi:Leucine-rich PPR motif-containing protein [Schistosoma japonicum]|uniref:Leucine-rich PPR motif-containing protein n=2 Tax=Schistosoma japonicum TaxID=6182 RepID=A0A4Z2D467_SCHJA|nr:Leucine-rich PPR motif-containing protein [Schistosoma japonicum]
MRISLGVKFDVNDVLADLEKANMSPSVRVLLSFIRQSCVAGDIEQAKSHMRLLRTSGFTPNPYAFSLMLHGYVKAGLSHEVVSLQEKLLDIGLWPSRIGYEGILSAYADLGDKLSFIKTLEEALDVLPLVEINETKQSNFIFPLSFIFDVYRRLICSQDDTDASCNEILTKIPLPLHSNAFAQDTVKILLARGRATAALEVFKLMDLTSTKDAFLYSLPRYAAHGGLGEEKLHPFWRIAARHDSHLKSLSDHTKSYFEQLVSKQSGDFNERITNAEDVVDSPNYPSSLASRLSSKGVNDPILYACALFRKGLNTNSLSFSINDIEQVFWDAVKNNSLKSVPESIKELNHLFILTKDYDGLKNFLHRLVSDSPEYISHFFNRMTLSGLLTKHTQENWDFISSILESEAIMDPSVCATIRLMENLRPLYPTLKNHVHSSWPVEILLRRLQKCGYSKKLTKLHWYIESFCKSNWADVVYLLQQQALRDGILLLPKTLKSIIATPYLIHGNLLEHPSLLPKIHELTSHYPVNLNNISRDGLKQFDALIKIPSSSQVSIDEIVEETVNWLTEYVPCHLFGTPINPSTTDIPTWMVICQRLFQTGSVFKDPVNWMYLALKWLEKTNDQVGYLNCFKDWFTYAPNNSTSTALLIAALTDSKSREWALSILSGRNDAIYDIIVSNSLNCLADENQNCLADIITEFGKTNTLAIARQIYRCGFDAPTLQYIINKLPEDELVNELVKLCAAKGSWLIPMSDFISEHYPEKKITFFNSLLTLLRTKQDCLDTLVSATKCIKNSMDLSQLDPINKWLISAVTKLSDFSVMPNKLLFDELESVLSNNGLLTSAIINDLRTTIPCRNYTMLVELLKSIDDKALDIVVPFLIYSFLTNYSFEKTTRLLHFTADIQERKLLSMFCKYFHPLTNNHLVNCYLALEDYSSGQSLDWLTVAGVKYFLLEPLQLKQKRNATMETTQDYVKMLPKASMCDFAQYLVDQQKNHKSSEYALLSIQRSWDIQKKLILLYNLVNLGAESLVKHILWSLPEADRKKYYSLKSLAHLIRIFSNYDNKTILRCESVDLVIQRLTNLPSDDLATTICNPHMDTLFRLWPVEHITNLISIVNKISESGISSVSSHLAGVLVNRGLYDQIDNLTRLNKPIPSVCLAGSSRYPLTESSFLSTLEFLNTNDPEHIAEFLDNCFHISNSRRHSTYKEINPS